MFDFDGRPTPRVLPKTSLSYRVQGKRSGEHLNTKSLTLDHIINGSIHISSPKLEGNSRGSLRWSHIVGQLGGFVKVYSAD